jgi:hypothetical protein
MKLCAYTPADEPDCLAIFDSNAPLFFATQERETFQRFLKRLAAPYTYYVVRDADGKIVACGGTKLETSNHSAWLRWDMVAREFHGNKIGTFLAMSRLWLISQIPEIELISLCTSQYTYLFYQKLGFVLQKVIPDGIVSGIDEYFMVLKLDERKYNELKLFSEHAATSLLEQD